MTKEMSFEDINRALGQVQGLGLKLPDGVKAVAGGDPSRIDPRSLRIESTNRAAARITGMLLEDNEPAAYAGSDEPEDDADIVDFEEVEPTDADGDEPEDKFAEDDAEDMNPGMYAESAAVDKGSLHKAKEEAKLAVNRINRGMQYGEDMGSSALLCYEDGINLLKKALEILKKAGAKI
jgi:exonuclease VII small subunit